MRIPPPPPEPRTAAARKLLETAVRRRARANPLRWVTPPGYSLPILFRWMPKQIEACQKLHSVKLGLFGAGNRAGKTEWAVRRTLGAAIGLDYRTLHEREDPPARWALGPPRRIWCVTTIFEKSRDTQQRYVWNRLPPALRMPRERWHPKSGFYGAKLTLTNGSEIVFKTAEQDLRTFEGDAVDFVWVDEEIPLEYVRACLVRTTDTRGQVIWTTWPSMPELEDIFVRRELYPGMEELLSERDVAAVWGGMESNLYLSPDEIRLQAALLPPEEREGRIYGRFAFKSGLVFPAYGDAHREDVEFPLPADWVRDEIIDPGRDNPCCVLFGAVSPDGVLHVYDEIYRRHRTVGEIAAEIFLRRWMHRGLMTPAQILDYQALIDPPAAGGEPGRLEGPPGGEFARELARNSELERIVRAWRAVKGDCAPRRVLIDEAAKQKTMGQPVDVVTQFAAFGIHGRVAPNAERSARELRLAEKLKPLAGRIELKVSRHCPMTDWELRHYKYKRPAGAPAGTEHEADREKTVQKQDHAIACLLYWVSADPRWEPPPPPPPRPGTIEAHHAEAQQREQGRRRGRLWAKRG